MNKTVKPIVVFFALFYTISSAKIFTDFEEICTTHTDKIRDNFSELPGKIPVKWDPIFAFTNGIRLGEGSFGLVKKVDYKTSKGVETKLAVKEMELAANGDKKQVLIEISALQAMRTSHFVPRLYGCMIKKPENQVVIKQNLGGYKKPIVAPQITMVYVAQEILHSDLDNHLFKNFIQTKLSVIESLKLWVQMFQGLKDLWNVGLVHNDIKPANMMTNKDYTRIYLIDLGLASISNGRVINGGSPIFMSPPKFEFSFTRVQQKDDFYSVALSIADIEANSYKDIFSKDKNNNAINSRCWTAKNTRPCREAFAYNVAKILEKAQYGSNNQAEKDKENINFTTLIVEMVKYDDFSFNVDDIISIINRLSGGINEDRQEMMVSKRIATVQETKEMNAKLMKLAELNKQQKLIEIKKKEAIMEQNNLHLGFNKEVIRGAVGKLKPGMNANINPMNKGNLQTGIDDLVNNKKLLSEIETMENEIVQQKKDINKGHLAADDFYNQEIYGFNRIPNMVVEVDEMNSNEEDEYERGNLIAKERARKRMERAKELDREQIERNERVQKLMQIPLGPDPYVRKYEFKRPNAYKEKEEVVVEESQNQATDVRDPEVRMGRTEKLQIAEQKRQEYAQYMNKLMNMPLNPNPYANDRDVRQPTGYKKQGQTTNVQEIETEEKGADYWKHRDIGEWQAHYKEELAVREEARRIKREKEAQENSAYPVTNGQRKPQVTDVKPKTGYTNQNYYRQLV